MWCCSFTDLELVRDFYLFDLGRVSPFASPLLMVMKKKMAVSAFAKIIGP
jgi:hypothetical protein